MTDRHRTKPMSLRLPEALSAWVEQQATATGKPKRRIILDAIEDAMMPDIPEEATQRAAAESRGRNT